MFAKICHRVGHGGGTEQSDPHDVVPDVVPIFAVVQETDAVIALAQVGPLVGAGLEARPVPARVAVGGSLHVAPLDLIRGLRREHIHGEGGLEQYVALVPFDVCVEVEPRRVVVQ